LQINSGIGDSILVLPLIHELARRDYEIHAIVNQFTKSIAKYCPDITKYYQIDYSITNIIETAKLIVELNKLQFTYYVGALPSNIIRDAFLPLILRIPIRIKHVSPHKERYRNYDFIFNRLARLNPNQNNTDSNLTLSRMLENSKKTGQVVHNIVLPDEVIQRMKLKLKELGYSEDFITIGVHPGCKETWAFKRWPPERYASLLDQIAKKNNSQMILFGGLEEKAIADYIIQKTEAAPLNLVGQLTLEETMTAIYLCHMFISNDSGLMHIATAFDIPVIGLFGKSNEAATGPYGPRHVVIKKNDVKDIAVGEVYEKSSNLFEEIAQSF